MLYDYLLAPFFEYGFMRRALIGAFAVSCGAVPVGVFLMLRRMSLMGDAMSHAILPGAAAGYFISGLSLGAMSLGGLIAGCAVALLAGIAARGTALREDTTLAAFYLISLALGIALISARGSNIDLLHVLFGSVLALDQPTLILIVSVASLSLLGMAIIFRPLTMESLDPQFLRVVSRSGAPVHMLFMLLVVLNLVGGFHALGTLLSVGMMMLPVAAARLWSEDISFLMLLALLFALLSSYIGLLLSYHFSLAAGPSLVLVSGGFYIFSLLFGRHGGFLQKFFHRPHLAG